MFVLLFDCSTVSQEWNRQEIAFAHSDGSLDGQTRALAHFAHFPPFRMTRHLAAWTNSDFGNFETRFDDCDHCPDDWKHQTELARSHLEALHVDCDDFLSQAQEETEEMTLLVIT